MRRLVCLSSLVIGVLAACGGDRGEPRFGKPADPARLLALLLEVGERPPPAIGAALAAGVAAQCGEACGCLAAVAPDAPPGTPSCPAANDTVPVMWPPMELAGRYLADQVAHAKARDRDQLLMALAAIAVPVPRVDRARWALPSATNHRPLSATTTLIGVGKDERWVAPMPIARFDARGARIDEAPGGATGKAAADLPAVADALARLQGKAPDAPATVDAPPPAPPPPPPPDDDDAVDDAQRARQEAIDRARRAGIIGPPLAQGDLFAELTAGDDLGAALDDVDVYGGLLGSDPDAPSGGFGLGRSGFGPGGGGTGWGTIGSGTGHRYGVMPAIVFGGQVGAALDAAAPMIAVDGATTAVRLAEIVAAHGGAIAVADGPRTAELPVVFGAAPDRRATAALSLSQGDGFLVVRAHDTLIGRWAPSGGRYDTAAIKTALAKAVSSPRPHVHLVVAGGTAAELVALIDLAVGAGAGTLRIQVTATSGYGTGRLGLRGAAPPQVSLGQPNAVGDLDKAIIRRYVKRQIAKITYCYEKELLTKPALEGTVQTQFFISPSGDVTSATASGVDPTVASCVAAAIKSITFPRPRGGGGVQVNYPFDFRRA